MNINSGKQLITYFLAEKLTIQNSVFHNFCTDHILYYKFICQMPKFFLLANWE